MQIATGVLSCYSGKRCVRMEQPPPLTGEPQIRSRPEFQLPQEARARGVHLSPLHPEKGGSDDAVVRLSSARLGEYGLKTGDTVTVRYGSLRRPVRIAEDAHSGRASDDTIGLDESVFRASGMQEDRKLRTRYDREKNELRFGPLIGVLSHRQNGEDPPKFAQADLVRRLDEFAAERGAAVAVMFPLDLNEKDGMVTAYVPKGNSWQKTRLPMPDAIYDRSFLREGPELTKGEELRRRWEADPDVTLINGDAIRELAKDKLAFADVLSRDRMLAPLVPETKLMTDPAVLDGFLEKDGRAIVKLRDGGAARGIFRVEGKPGDVTVTYTDREAYKRDKSASLQHIRTSFPSSADAYAFIRSRHPDGEFIAQEQIDLLTYNGAPFEFRVAFQKGAEREWRLLQVTARVNRPDAVIGGLGEEFTNFQPVLSELFPEDAEDKLRDMVYAAKRTLKLMEQETGKPGADMVVDFTYDTSGKPYIIEANSKQSHFWKNAGKTPAWVKRHTNIIDYAASAIGLDKMEPLTRSKERQGTGATRGRRIEAEPLGTKDGRVYLAQADRDRLGVSFGDTIKLRFGEKTVPVKVAYAKSERANESGTWRVSKDVATRVPDLPGEFSFLERWNPNTKELSLGPFVGMLARQDQFGDHLTGEPFGDSTEELYDMCMESRGYGGALYVMSPEGVNTEKRTVAGYVPVPGRDGTWRTATWKKTDLPFPDVLWPRHFSHTSEQRRNAARVKNHLIEAGIPTLNSAEFSNLIGNKRRFAEFIEADPELRRFAPETRQLGSPTVVETMLDKHGMVYLKPVDGTKGKGIVKVWKDRSGYHGTYKEGDRVIHRHGRNATDILVAARVPYAERQYLCQQGLDLARYGGSIFDVRALTQKNGDRWQVTGMAARVASSADAPTSNLHAGGHAYTVDHVLSPLFPPDKRAAIERSIQEAAVLLASKIDAGRAGGKATETGVDIGIDTKGNVWFIEANPIPGRGIFLDTGEKDKRHQACSIPMRTVSGREGFVDV